MDRDMTDLSAPTKPGPRGLDLGGGRRAGLVAVVVLGPLSITVLRGILPYHATDDSATIAAKVAAHPTAQAAVLWLTLVAMITLIPGVIAVGLLATRHSRLLGTWGVALAVAGFSLLWAVTAIDFTALAGAQSDIGRDATTRVLDELNTSPTLTMAVTAFIVGHVLGMVLIGVALLRGRAIWAWAAWALVVSQPLHIVFAVVVPSNVLDAAAWALTTVGFAAAAVTITGRSPTQPAVR
jgi:hypothetical protein